MGIRVKFAILTALVGVLMVVISIMGYVTSSSNLEKSVESELTTIVRAQGEDLSDWLCEKNAYTIATATMMTNFHGNMDLIKTREVLSAATGDKDILDLTIGLEDKYLRGFNAGDKTGEIDPTVCGWYNQCKEKGVGFTEPYVDAFTNQVVVSGIAPIKNNGKFIGAVVTDISLKTLENKAAELKYAGKGIGLIIDPKGQILASTTDTAPAMSAFQDVPRIGPQFESMMQQGNGFVKFKGIEGDSLFAFTKVEATGWMVGISIPESVVFADLNKMKIGFIMVTIFGMALMLFLCWKMAKSITAPIVRLQECAEEFAKGNLAERELPPATEDEIGALTKAFKNMSEGLRELIGKMAQTSEQVAASSEELTANASQSADAAVHVAETVNDVSAGMERQLKDIDVAKQNVDAAFEDISKMACKAEEATEASQETSEAARMGAELMGQAIDRMGSIEKSVMASAEVVRKLGENSKQIGQIVEAISSIAEQTNLLSLNAAIEAARAGEHGRGFAVVADEVRKLASESQDSAEKIKDRIASIQRDTERAVAAMESGTGEVQDGTRAIRTVGEKFQDIMDKVNGIQTKIAEINTSVDVVADSAGHFIESIDSIDTVSRKTAENTQTISSATEEQSASNQEIAAATHSLANLAAEMQEAIGKFKL